MGVLNDGDRVGGLSIELVIGIDVDCDGVVIVGVD